ncbi:hypothetical protein NEFER01_1466 [Nematocida sp. LUAm1]|nr:hypothetical protein NEFER02_1672 [Nematocida sp. LUAm2]KAI5178299.1 hypothetical protein NEFER01_1466 [Nematocida sp. LUAm1]
MENAAYETGALVKSQDQMIERIEREKLELKMQINHLKSQIKELTNQTSISMLPTCDCKAKKEETQKILEQAKRAVENLIMEKETLSTLYTETDEKNASLQEENSRLRNDCTKLSEHIARKQQKEKDAYEALEQMREEIHAAQTQMEQNGVLSSELKIATKRYNDLKTEYLKLEEFSRTIETEYKEEVLQKRQLAQDKEAQVRRLEATQKRMEEIIEHSKGQEKDKQIREKVIEEMKREKKALSEQRDSIERRAEEIITERERQIRALQKKTQDLNEYLSRVSGRMGVMESELEEEVRRVIGVESRLSPLYLQIKSNQETAYKAINRTHKEHMEYAEKLATTYQDAVYAKKEIERRDAQLTKFEEELLQVKRNKEQADKELAEIKTRLELTPNAMNAARHLGVKHFTTLNDLFLLWSEEKENLLAQSAQKLEKREEMHKEEERKRVQKIEEFQNKLKVALSELSFCRDYLEKKKHLIKSLKKHPTADGLMRVIDVSLDK